jgi:hypothetical protein
MAAAIIVRQVLMLALKILAGQTLATSIDKGKQVPEMMLWFPPLKPS